MKRTNGKEGSSLLVGATQIALGGLIAKVIGALYRIPLTNLVGGEGIGLYQLVYPLYCVLLTVSATGIPSSIAALAAKRREADEPLLPLFRTCMRLFLCIGGVSTLLMVALAPVLARAQGEPNLAAGYVALAPSVLLVSAISVFRGYFQGQSKMLPTALSEVIEQAVKVAVGLATAYFFRDDVYRAVTALLFSVTVSELVALFFLWIRFRRVPAPKQPLKTGEPVRARTVLKLSIPVTLSACLIPLFSMVDSILIVRLLRPFSDNAVALYGLFSGGAVTVINLPVSVCYGIAAASVPALSAAIRRGESGRRRLMYSLGLTLLLSSVAAVGLYLLAEPAVRLLFRSLAESELSTLTGLVRAFAVSAVTLSCTQTLAACLTALERPSRAALSMAIAMLVRTALTAILVRRPEVSVYGAAWAADVGYALSFALDFAFAMRATRRRALKSA